MKKIFFLLVIANLPTHASDMLSLLQDIEVYEDKKSNSAASRSLESSDLSPSVVRVFTQKDIVKFDSLYSLLNSIEGITIEELHYNSKNINVRGFRHEWNNNKVLVLINGIKLSDPVANETRLDIIPKEAIKRLEVIKGASSVLYGSNAYALTINVVTFSGEGYEESSLTSYLGPNGTRGIQVNQIIKENGWNGLFAFKTHNAFQRIDSANDISHASIENDHLTYKQSNMLAVIKKKGYTITMGQADNRRKREYDLTSPYIDSNFMTPAGHRMVTTNYNSKFFGFKKESDFSDKLKSTLYGSYNKTSQDFDLNGPPLFHSIFEGSSIQVDWQLDYQIEDGLKLTGGYNIERSKFGVSSRGQSNLQAGVVRFLPAGVIPFITPDPYDTVGQNKSYVHDYYLQIAYDLNDRLRLYVADRRNTSSFFPSEHTPKATMVYQAKKGHTFKMSVGKAFRYPDAVERFIDIPWMLLKANNNLQPEKISSKELSYIRKFDDDQKEFSITYFDLEQENLIDVQAQVNRVVYENIEGYASKGFEWKYSFNTHKYNAHVSGIYQHVHSLLDDHNQVIGNFRQKYNLAFDYQLNDRFNLYTNSWHQGSQVGDPNNNYTERAAYSIFNFGVKYSHSKQRSFQIDVFNAFDKNYTFSDYSGISGEAPSIPRGRNILLSYKVSF